MKFLKVQMEFCRNPSHSPTPISSDHNPVSRDHSCKYPTLNRGTVPNTKDLPRGLQTALNQIAINSLYSPQVEALTHLRMGKDSVLQLPRLPGKPCYNPAILESCLNNPETSALYIFPLKPWYSTDAEVTADGSTPHLDNNESRA